MIRAIFVCAATLTLAGCAYETELIRSAQLRPLGGGEYDFVAPAWSDLDAKELPDEDMRLEALSKVMKNNGFCPQGWEVIDRNSVLAQRGLVGENHHVFYRVRCLGK